MIPRQLDLVPAISRPSFISSAPTRPVQPPTAVRRTHYALCSTSDNGSSTYRLFTVEASVVPPMELRQITQTEAQSAATHDDDVDDDERHSENGGADSIKAVAPTTTMAAQGRRRRPRSHSSRQFFVAPSSGAQFAAVAVQEFEPLACIIVRTTPTTTTTSSSSSVSADASHTMLCATRVASMPLAELHPMEVRHDDDESVPEQWRSLASARSRRALRQEWRTMDELDQVSGGSRWEMEEAEVETPERNAKVPRREVAEEMRASTRTTTAKSATTTATTFTNQKHGDATTATTTASTHTPATHTTKDVVVAEDMSLDAIATKVIADLVAHDKTEASTKELDKIILKQLPTFSAVAEKMKVPHTRAEAMSWFREMQAALRSWLEERCYDVDPAGVVHFGG